MTCNNVHVHKLVTCRSCQLRHSRVWCDHVLTSNIVIIDDGYGYCVNQNIHVNVHDIQYDMERFVLFNIKILADFHIETFFPSLLSVNVDRANLPHGYEVIAFCSGACVCVCAWGVRVQRMLIM